jgi:hypothetical protein
VPHPRQAPDALACAELRARVLRCIAMEKELLVEPEMFLELLGRADGVADVRLDMKRGEHHRHARLDRR